jgi:DNA segregation ATPase FtsK/SpoIIIE, S-DNA-T family
VATTSTLSRRASEFAGVAVFAASLIWLIALVTHEPTDPVWFFTAGDTHRASNFVGLVGAFLSEVSLQVLGYTSYLVPAVLGVVGWNLFWCRPVDSVYTKATGAGLFVGCLSALFALVVGSADANGHTFRAGGYVGEWIGGLCQAYLNRPGAIIVVLTLLALAVILSTQFSFGRTFRALFDTTSSVSGRGLGAFRTWREERRREAERREVIAKHTRKNGPAAGAEAATTVAAARAARAKERDKDKERGKDRSKDRVPAVDDDDDLDDQPAASAPLRGASVGSAPQVRERARVATPGLPLSDSDATSRTPVERRMGGFNPPPLSLLDAPKTERKLDERELMEGARLLEEKCREFAVEGSVVQIHPGPVVTTFEYKPEAGVKYSKITSLAEDLCLALQAESIIIDRLPGKSTVGIQVPNHIREQISLRELLESEDYRRSPSKLTLALGKTIHGEPFLADLAAMPHLLIAGSTGTGKSVGLNAMLTSILYRATPDDVRLIMIDPKRLELGMYENIPHLLTPVVVDPKQASNALRWAVHEMEERYKTLAAQGVRNIDQYNRNLRHLIEEAAEKGEGELPRPLPFIVVVIDELADLMMVAGNEVEESICRLAQMARAVGIHLILATQRPSVDVITGLIKANLPARIAFRVSSRIDSRTVLDGNGAEQLLGKGDMLFLPPASSRYVRLHGPYISEQESARLASFLRKQGKPVYDETITAEEKTTEAMEFEKDDLYDEAARIVVQSGQASISYLQRRLRIGFSRAARLVDMMEADGLVSGASGGKAREVLVGKDYFDEVDAHTR